MPLVLLILTSKFSDQITLFSIFFLLALKMEAVKQYFYSGKPLLFYHFYMTIKIDIFVMARYQYFVFNCRFLDTDECQTNNGGCQQICTNNPGSYG